MPSSRRITSRALGKYTPPPPSYSCAFPLDDSGTVAASLGVRYAGPAVGDGQQRMDYTAALTGSAHLHTANVTSGDFNRPASGQAVFGATADAGNTVAAGGLAMLVVTAGGTIRNFASVVIAPGSSQQIYVAADGTVSASTALNWYAGSTTVGATEKFVPFLWGNAGAAGQRAIFDLHTVSGSIPGTHPANTVDPCGNPV